MTNPIFLIPHLNEAVAQCDIAQEMIDNARAQFPDPEPALEIQLEIAQTRLDIRRLQIDLLLEGIPSRS